MLLKLESSYLQLKLIKQHRALNTATTTETVKTQRSNSETKLFVLRLPADCAMIKPPKIAAVTGYLDRSVPVTSSPTS